MKSKKQQFNEMVLDVCGLGPCKGGCDTSCGGYIDTVRLYNKGYRKADEVIDEFIERLKEENEISLRRYGKGIGMTTIFKIADEMKFELFKQQEDNNG